MRTETKIDLKFQDAVLSKLHSGEYVDIEGKPLGGQAVSFLKRQLHDDGWKHLGGGLGDFEYLCEQHGFTIVPGRNRRNQRARVVTV